MALVATLLVIGAGFIRVIVHFIFKVRYHIFCGAVRVLMRVNSQHSLMSVRSS